MPGSSATASTRPPLVPVTAEFINASAATFNPTCFMQTRALFPAQLMPRASSYATFSLVDQNAWMSPLFLVRRSMNSKISVDGVPG